MYLTYVILIGSPYFFKELVLYLLYALVSGALLKEFHQI